MAIDGSDDRQADKNEFCDFKQQHSRRIRALNQETLGVDPGDGNSILDGHEM